MASDNKSSRGDQTRESLLRAAVEVFGRDGFHAASTRSIATEAGVNQALIGYHFGGKEGLYAAVFDLILDAVAEVMLPQLGRCADRLRGLTREDPEARDLALQSLEELVSSFTAGLGRAAEANWAPLIMREQQDPSEVYEKLYQQLYQPLFAVLTRGLAILLDVPDDSDVARVRSMMLMGQVIVFLAARATTARVMGWQELGPEQLEFVRQQFLASIRDEFSAGSGP